ncbi:MAG: peptidylprolyl isomerase, partial [Paracoccaceae bacterium]
MNRLLFGGSLALLANPLAAQEAEAVSAPSPNQIVAEAAAEEWVAIAPDDLLVMTLAPDAQGNARQAVIQLMPAPFSQGWVENIRTLARAGWYDGVSINRVQDNYVVQWGDPNVDNPEADGDAKALPEGLQVMDEEDYVETCSVGEEGSIVLWHPRDYYVDSYGDFAQIDNGWPTASEISDDTRVLQRWPVHCYGMVGVGRSYSPDTGTGAELYTVIGHAPRHLDRNIALVGRVIEGIEHLSSLPRGKGDLGFYVDPAKRVPIKSIVLGSELREPPRFEYLSTEGETFARYAE